MDLNIDLIRLAEALTKHSALRQSVIAENVANADTPGYKARDIVDFSDSYNVEHIEGAALRATRPGHLAPLAAPPENQIFETAVTGAESPNGNTVSLEDQMLRAVEVRQSHDLALGVYAKSLDILRAAVQRGR